MGSKSPLLFTYFNSNALSSNKKRTRPACTANNDARSRGIPPRTDPSTEGGHTVSESVQLLDGLIRMMDSPRTANRIARL